MSRIPDDEINRIKREVDLVALVRSKGVELKKHGSKDLIGFCPFHDDKKTPNLIITPHKNLWNCMGCDKGGSVIDFVMKYEGVSFRHAFELLKEANPQILVSSSKPVKKSTVPKLSSSLDFTADDETLLKQVIDFYHQRLFENSEALEYLHKRGITDEAIKVFKIGFADRTLGLRLPYSYNKEGAQIRERLKKLGILRVESGHEHFNGSVVFPIFENQKLSAVASAKEDSSTITEVYGRKIGDHLRKGTIYHLYLPGPHRGIYNPDCLKCRDIILTESIIDALTFWCNGFKNVTSIYGTNGFTDELLQALIDAKIDVVRLAYDNDKAGNKAAERDVKRLCDVGIKCLRVKFPYGMDANEYALKVRSPSEALAKDGKPADKSLQMLLNATEQSDEVPTSVGGSTLNNLAANLAAKEKIDDTLINTEDKSVAEQSDEIPTLVGAKEKNYEPLVKTKDLNIAERSDEIPTSVGKNLSASASLRDKSSLEAKQTGDDYLIEIGDRNYRIRGLQKNNSLEVLKINLRLWHNDLFYLDEINLYNAKAREQFINRAASETCLKPELIKRDIGKLLLKLEEIQEQRLSEILKPKEPEVIIEEKEREEALLFLKGKNLMQRLLDDFDKCGTVGEVKNKETAWLACVSRKLEKPLAIIIQSSSAAGKSTLMEAVLSFFPEEEQLKYSAMTGQSLYYLGETDLKHKILAIVEEEGAERASYALKLLQSEGELTIASTGKDPETGRMQTEEYHVEGPVMIFLTTTAIDIDEELMNRCLVLTVDEGREQTKRIHEQQRIARTMEGLIASEERKIILKRQKNVQRLLKTYHIVNPYARKLTFSSDCTRTRRDHEKYLTLIDAIALVHQHQRKIEWVKVGDNKIASIQVTIEDMEIANKLAPEILGRSLDELPPQTRRMLNLIKELVKAECKERKIEQSEYRFTRRKIREQTGWSLTQVKLHLDRLQEYEYVICWNGKLGRTFEYEFLLDVEAPDKKHVIGLIDVKKLKKKHNYDDNLSDSEGHLSE